jgi:hypothetical protein
MFYFPSRILLLVIHFVDDDVWMYQIYRLNITFIAPSGLKA